MKRLLIAAIGLACATAIVVQAQEGKPAKKELTPEQQTVMTEMLGKYDANKNGKLEKDERAKMSQEDKDKMIAAGLMKGQKPAHHAEGTNAPAGGEKK